MKLKNFILQNCRSSLLFVVQILVLLIGALFFAGGCPNEPSEHRETTEAAFKKFTGKWRLTYSSNPLDSSFVNSAWIELRADSFFASNTSFFWKDDYVNVQPLTGRWWTTHTSPTGYYDGSSTFIQLSIESTYKGWELGGNGTGDSTMTWADPNPYTVRYRWKIY